MTFAYPSCISLATLPTPLQHLKRLSDYLGGPQLYVKRDDLTGMELSGNKVRKLEFLLAEALNQEADVVITYGGVQSNHCRATAAACAKLGLDVHLLIRGEAEQPYDGNLLLDELFGAQVTFHPADEFRTHTQRIVEACIESYKRQGRTPYYFPVGASVPLGCWGYVRAFEETRAQLEALGISACHMVTAVGSGGTLAGLLLGRELLGARDVAIWGINVCDDAAYFQREVRQLLDETNRKFHLGLAIDKIPINVIDGYVGEGYSIPYKGEIETMKLVGRMEAIALDPVYTGKAFHGMLEQMKKGTFPRSSSADQEAIVFFHTGGTFGLFPQREHFTFV
jgi:D-cysteine desulfhydrase